MRAGRLRHRVTIQQASHSTNAMGETYMSYSDWKTVWASIEPNSGRMYYEAQQANSEVEGTIVMRYIDGLVPAMRVSYGSRIFRILAIVHRDEKGKELHLLYKEDRDEAGTIWYGSATLAGSASISAAGTVI